MSQDYFDISDFFIFSAEGNPPAQITWWINATHKVSLTHNPRHHLEVSNGHFLGAMGWDGFFPQEPLTSMDFRWFCYP